MNTQLRKLYSVALISCDLDVWIKLFFGSEYLIFSTHKLKQNRAGMDDIMNDQNDFNKLTEYIKVAVNEYLLPY